MQTLAYGGKGLLWFTYWTPPDGRMEWSHAMIGPDGKRTPQYDMIKRVNVRVQAIGSELLKAESIAAYQLGKSTMDPTPPPPPLTDAPLKIEGDAELTIGLFRVAGKHLALIANRDCAKPAEVKATLNAQSAEMFNAAERSYAGANAVGNSSKKATVTLQLPPGDAVLLRW